MTVTEFEVYKIVGSGKRKLLRKLVVEHKQIRIVSPRDNALTTTHSIADISSIQPAKDNEDEFSFNLLESSIFFTFSVTNGRREELLQILRSIKEEVSEFSVSSIKSANMALLSPTPSELGRPDMSFMRVFLLLTQERMLIYEREGDEQPILNLSLGSITEPALVGVKEGVWVVHFSTIKLVFLAVNGIVAQSWIDSINALCQLVQLTRSDEKNVKSPPAKISISVTRDEKMPSLTIPLSPVDIPEKDEKNQVPKVALPKPTPTTIQFTSIDQCLPVDLNQEHIEVPQELVPKEPIEDFNITLKMGYGEIQSETLVLDDVEDAKQVLGPVIANIYNNTRREVCYKFPSGLDDEIDIINKEFKLKVTTVDDLVQQNTEFLDVLRGNEQKLKSTLEFKNDLYQTYRNRRLEHFKE
ncbi:hypothetical protein PCE1_000477 [Barthelona sp. PCE]